MQRRKFLLGALALLAAAPEFAAAQRGWLLLGTTRINLRFGRDRITVTRNRVPVSALSFRTRGSSGRVITLTDLEVFFDRGPSERRFVQTRIRPNSQSNVIFLRTRDRVIRRVQFTFRPSPNARDIVALELYGRR